MVERVANDHSVFIISGRKGTGKTILAKYIEKAYHNKGFLTKVFSKEDLFLNYILEKTEDSFTQAELVIFLRYCILVAIAKHLVENENEIIQNPKINNFFKLVNYKINQHKLKKFYFDVYPRGAFKTFNEERQQQNTSSLIGHKFTIGGQTVRKKHLQRKQYYELLTELERLVFSVCKYVDIFVFFDDLDELESKKYLSAKTENVFITLLETIQSINSSFFQLGMSNSKIVILLRSDILQDLNTRSSNLNKMAIDGSVNLNWIKSTKLDETHPLMDLILSKIQKKCYPNLSKKEVYKQLFSGVNYINKRPFIKYLIDNSFGRPRDIITSLNIIIEKYPDRTSFDEKMFTDAECRRDYSRHFSDEIKNELSIHCSEAELLSLLTLLKKFGRRNFEYAKLEKFFNDNKNSYNAIQDLKSSIEMLYKFGVLGNTWHNSATNQYNHTWAYREDGFPDADFGKKFCIHHAMRKELNLI